MDKKSAILLLPFLITLGLFGLSSFLKLDSMWGINHLRFLPDFFTYLFWFVTATVIYIMLGPIPHRFIDSAIATIDNWLWGERRWPRLVFVAGCCLCFYLFRTETHFLGDGYSWISIFGQGDSYIHKWAEPGSIYIVRLMQRLLGGYTLDTALVTFRTLSILSGAVVIYNSISILGMLTSDGRLRVFGLVSLIFSGTVLLFFGYVEFYPISWAATIVFIRLSVMTLKDNQFLWAALLSYIIAVSMHLQAVYFLPGVAYLIIQRLRHERTRKVGYTTLAVLACAVSAALIWLYNAKIEFEILILPFLEGRPIAPDYTVFGYHHLSDLANLVLIVFPGCLIAFVFWLLQMRSIRKDSLSVLLGMFSVGSLAFLFVYGAAITMARDWDILSLSLLAPCLWILYQMDQSESRIPNRVVAGYSLITAFVTLSFLSVCTRAAPSEARNETVLNDRDRSSWVVYADYLRQKGDSRGYKSIVQAMNVRFPDYVELERGYDLLESHQYKMSLHVAQRLVLSDPYEPDFLQLLGNVHRKMGRFKEAGVYLYRALTLNPYQSALMNEIGQVYLAQSKYDSAVGILTRARALSPERTFITESLALAYSYLDYLDSARALADTLLMHDPNSPGGHLIKMTVALRTGEVDRAKFHMREYLKYGSARSDYQNIQEYYQYLLE